MRQKDFIYRGFQRYDWVRGMDLGMKRIQKKGSRLEALKLSLQVLCLDAHCGVRNDF